jgi:hypothetical protein
MSTAAAAESHPRLHRARKGRRAEHEVRHHLESLGWLVLRSAGSKGPFDLVAFPSARSRGPEGIRADRGRWLGISVRSNRRGRHQAEFERDELRDLAKAHGGRACFVRRLHGRLSEGQDRLLMEL